MASAWPAKQIGHIWGGPIIVIPYDMMLEGMGNGREFHENAGG